MEATQKAMPIMIVLLKIQRKYKKDYSFPTQMKIIKLLERWHKIKRSKATLNRWLRIAEDKGYIIRKRRIKRDKTYGIMFKSTMYKITIKGYKILKRFSVNVAKELEKYQKWIQEIKPKRGKEVNNEIIKRKEQKKKIGEIIKDLIKKDW